MPLKEQTVGSLTIDGCDQCGGVWFDANELGALATTGQTAVGWAEQLFEPGGIAETVEGEGVLCPKCGVALYGFEFKHTPGVRLDACPECKGIWVDDRELEAISARMLERQKATTERLVVQPHLRERYRRSAPAGAQRAGSGPVRGRIARLLSGPNAGSWLSRPRRVRSAVVLLGAGREVRDRLRASHR